MSLFEIRQEIQGLETQLTLSLTNPRGVKLQLKQITLLQKQLRALKKEVNVEIRKINQSSVQSSADSVISVGLDVFGKHKWAGRMRAETRRSIESEKKSARQPYMDVRDHIDSLLMKGDCLKLEGDVYLTGES